MELSTSFPVHKGSLQDLIRAVKWAEEIGFNSITISDDFVFRDIFPVLALLAKETDQVTLSFITNPYSRHPAMIARAVATLDEISNGRVSLGLCAGGSLTLKPLCIQMWNRPISAVKEAIEICRLLLRGKTVDYNGKVFKLKGARLLPAPHRKEIPIFIAGRSPRMLQTAGMLANGVLFGSIPISYFDFGIEQVKKGAHKAGRTLDEIKVEGGVSFIGGAEVEFKKYSRWRSANILMDTPDYVLEKSQIEPIIMEAIKKIKKCRDISEATRFVTDDITKLFLTTNTAESCIGKARELARKGINRIVIRIPSGKENQLYPIIRDEIIPALKDL